jgi:Ser/Thr protein kinase RdoA (MazF antagonist)
MFEDEATLVAAAKLLRRYHDSVDGFEPPPDPRWRFVAPGAHEIICHNDWSPSNALFRGHVPIAMLDWDSAGPGSRAWDLAGSAYRWVPLNPRVTPPSLGHKAARFAQFRDAYGENIGLQDVFDALTEALRLHADAIQAEADAGDPGAAKLVGWSIPAVLRADSDTLLQQRDMLCGLP